jgi:hypothetical protein
VRWSGVTRTAAERYVQISELHLPRVLEEIDQALPALSIWWTSADDRDDCASALIAEIVGR